MVEMEKPFKVLIYLAIRLAKCYLCFYNHSDVLWLTSHLDFFIWWMSYVSELEENQGNLFYFYFKVRRWGDSDVIILTRFI